MSPEAKVMEALSGEKMEYVATLLCEKIKKSSLHAAISLQRDKINERRVRYWNMCWDMPRRWKSRNGHPECRPREFNKRHRIFASSIRLGGTYPSQV
jgi:hypothetical protein